jgi:D-alanyl-D-alanine carboxypeptidase (penicillin-binding protein 5/6)
VRRIAAAGCLVLALLAAAARAAPAPAVPENPFAGAGAAYLVVADDAPLWAQAPDAPLPPASLTKLMTLLLVAETTSPDAIVVISAAAARAGGARMGLSAGTRIAVRELVAGALLRSGNDACLALAERVDGSEARFVARMNARAAALGLAATHFANACGFDAPGHVSSARDVATLAQRVLAQPLLAELAARDRYTARAADGRTWRLASTNLLMGLVPGLKGVKTGYTTKAGRCLVGYAERGAHRVLVVLLGAHDRWWDAVAMIEQAFAQVGAPAPDAAPGAGGA